MSRVRKFIPITELYKLRDRIHDGTVEEDSICQFMSFIDSTIFREVPNELKTDSLCLYAIDCNERNLFHIPVEKRTKQMYEIAVERSLDMIGSVPEEFMTFQLAYKACSVKPHWIFHHDAIPIHPLIVDLLPKDLTNFTNLRSWHLRKPERHSSICRLYLKRDGLVLQWVIEPTLDECKTAFAQNPLSLQFIPSDVQKEMIEEIMEQCIININLWKYLAKNIKPYLAKCLVGWTNSPDTLQDVMQKNVLSFLF